MGHSTHSQMRHSLGLGSSMLFQKQWVRVKNGTTSMQATVRCNRWSRFPSQCSRTEYREIAIYSALILVDFARLDPFLQNKKGPPTRVTTRCFLRKEHQDWQCHCCVISPYPIFPPTIPGQPREEHRGAEPPNSARAFSDGGPPSLLGASATVGPTPVRRRRSSPWRHQFGPHRHVTPKMQ